jgi:hypothetical protein
MLISLTRYSERVSLEEIQRFLVVVIIVVFCTCDVHFQSEFIKKNRFHPFD